MLLDNFREIAYRTDYFTTLSLLQVFTTINNDHFWEEKWKIMYDEKYVPFFTNQDSFLIMERKHFCLIFNASCCEGYKLYKNILYEHKELKMNMEKYGSDKLKYIKVNVKKQFIIIYMTNVVVAQFDDFYEAEDYIENDMIEKRKSFIYGLYHIINMDHVVVCFSDVKLQRKPNSIDCSYKYDALNFKRYLN